MLFGSFLLAILVLSVSSTEGRRGRRKTAGTVTCGSVTGLDQHDCNVALLSLGGGIQGAIQLLAPGSKTTSATSGTCKITATTTDGSHINISKGRLEGNGAGVGFTDIFPKCNGKEAEVVIKGGTIKGGNVRLSLTKA